MTSSTSGNLLAIDVGNTSVFLALFEKGRVVKTARFMTDRLEKDGGRALRAFRGRAGAAAVASVVPGAAGPLASAIRRELGLKALVAGKDFAVPIRNLYANPRRVGVDRLLNALAAYRKTRRETIVVDFGTAITFDVVSKNGEYLGGLIAPGIETSLDALYERTALLPRIRMAHPRRVVARTTEESIRAGCAYGIGGLCDAVVSAVARERGWRRPPVIATGGYASFIKRYCSGFRVIDELLTVKGIFLSLHK